MAGDRARPHPGRRRRPSASACCFTQRLRPHGSFVVRRRCRRRSRRPARRARAVPGRDRARGAVVASNGMADGAAWPSGDGAGQYKPRHPARQSAARHRMARPAPRPRPARSSPPSHAVPGEETIVSLAAADRQALPATSCCWSRPRWSGGGLDQLAMHPVEVVPQAITGAAARSSAARSRAGRLHPTAARTATW